MEGNIDHLFHSAYPIPPQHQPFTDSHGVVQDQFHRTSHSFPIFPASILTPKEQRLISTTSIIVPLHPQMTIRPPHPAANPKLPFPKTQPHLPIRFSPPHLSTTNPSM